MTWRYSLYLCLLAFVITLGLIIGWRLSDQAMAVLVGVVAGVAASIPTSLFVVWVALHGRSGFGPAQPMRAAAPAPEPQVIIVHAAPAGSAPPPPQSQRSLTVLPAYAAPEPTALNGLPLGPRHFTIMGEYDAQGEPGDAY